MALVLTPPALEEQQQQRGEEEAQQGPASMPLAGSQGQGAPQAGGTAALRSLSDATRMEAAAAEVVKVHVTLSAAHQQLSPGAKEDPGQAPEPAAPHHEEEQRGPAGAAADAPSQAAQQLRAAVAAGLEGAGLPASARSTAPPPPPRSHEPSAAALQALQQQHGEARRQRVQAYVAALQQQQQHRRSIAACHPISEEASQAPPLPGPGAGAAARQQSDPRDDVPVREDVPAWAAKLRGSGVGAAAAQGSSSNYAEFCQREFVYAHGDFQQSGGWARACGCMPM